MRHHDRPDDPIVPSYPDDPVVRSYSVTHPVGEVRLPTQPGWDQVIYAKTGLFVARTEDKSWVVPRHRTLCVADGTSVRLRTREGTAVRCLYLRTELGAHSGSTRVINITALTRELLLRAVDLAPFDRQAVSESSLLTLLIEQLAADPTAPLQLPLPTDRRALGLAELLLAEPSRTLGSAIGTVAASRRTLERLFRAETDMTLAGWQRRARVLAAIERMSNGSSITAAANSVGYSTPSSFVVAFRSELGDTPGSFMKEHRRARGDVG